MALVYARERTVPSVAITPTTPEVRSTAARAPGSTTPITGIGSCARSAGSAAAVAVLHATTSIFTPRPNRCRAASSEYRTTVAGDLVPYGTRAESPR
jgi:hypothetical protein